MIKESHVLVVDVDGTLCPIKSAGETYHGLHPEPRLLARLQELAAAGWHIVIHSARGMRTHGGNAGAINAHVLPALVSWLDLHGVPYHEVYVGKPWPGSNGFYIDDRSVRPREFIENSLEELDLICQRDRLAGDGGCQG